MANPDGVTISQTQKMTNPLKAIYEQDKARGLTDLSQKDYLKTWKANALGVDINRNFPSGWESLDSPDGPSSYRYRGSAPGDQPETKALMAYTQSHSFSATVSYHATGSDLYWQYGTNQAVNSQSYSLASALQAFTKYTVTDAEGLDSGGYKDWAMDALGIPSVTIEIGSRDCPLPLDEFSTVWARNLNVPAALAAWVKTN
jgi:g-D-glutamyl-meso-diaminopimelate peptidase